MAKSKDKGKEKRKKPKGATKKGPMTKAVDPPGDVIKGPGLREHGRTKP